MPALEVQASVVTAARKQGYGGEIVSALVAHPSQEPTVREVIAHTSDENVASTRVLLACGYERARPGSEPRSIRYRSERVPGA